MTEERVRRVALTGGIATGKSHVRVRFDALGIPTIDADVLARDAVAPGTPGMNDVIRRFGEGILDARGALDRKKLGAIVFADSHARRDLEKIIHPFVQEATDRWFATLDPKEHPCAIADIPLLFEARRDGDFEVVIVAACEPGRQLERLMNRDGVTEEEARHRISAQWPLPDKIAKADYVIRTDGTFDDTNRQVDAVASQLRSRPGGDHQRPTANH